MSRDSYRKKTSTWDWSEFKVLSLGIVIITIVISLFDYNPDMYFWLIEIMRNFVISFCISMTLFALSILFRLSSVILNWFYFLKSLLLFALSGFLGGIIAWGINDVLFGFNITHPWFYFIITSSLAVIFGFVIYGYNSIKHQFRVTAAKLAEKEINEQKIMNLKTKAELEALRAKVNPHFFFNTLNSIASLIPGDPVKAEELVEKLSHLFRYTLDASNNDMVKLGKELEFIREYLEIEKVRLGERLDYTIEADNGLDEIEIPGMILQPLVENNIKHGISPIRKGGEIEIKCSRSGEKIMIRISDNGRGLDQDGMTEGFGLKSVKERLHLIYGDKAKFELRSSKGVEIIIEIPVNIK